MGTAAVGATAAQGLGATAWVCVGVAVDWMDVAGMELLNHPEQESEPRKTIGAVQCCEPRPNGVATVRRLAGME